MQKIKKPKTLQLLLPCSKKGICCDCLKSHLANRELPACRFPNDIEKTYNRSFEKFAEFV